MALGSAGDVLPFVAVARGLLARGHRVELASNPRVAGLVRASGVPFVAVGSLRDAERTESHPRLWHPIDGFGVLWRHLVVPALQPTLDVVVEAHASRERLVVVSSPLSFGARVARELLDIDLVTVSLAPMNIPGAGGSMFLGPWRVPASVPQSWRQGLWHLADRWKLQPLMREKFLPWRKQLGLPDMDASVLGPWMRSPDGHQAWFPRWFADTTDRWDGVPQFDFPLISDPELQSGLSPIESEWLGSGPRPVMVYPGSGRRSSQDMVAAALAAAAVQGLRAVVALPSASGLPASSAAVLYRSRVRFDDWLPHVAAVIHHGGIGTVGQAFRAGAPQLIWPSAYDQFENAWRVERLGAGKRIGSLRARAWREALSRTLALPRLSQGSDGTPEIVAALEDR